METEPDHLKVGLRAIIYLRSWEHGPECQAYCEAQGYRASIVYDLDGTRYAGVFDAVVQGQAEVIVVWSFADLPSGRVPRVEPVELMQPPEPPRNRRPRVVRWPKK